ncbi:16S rRNA processing protein RimM [Marinicauda algicola]|uniref:Ribosome maturation factor RimM n=1 Tax=Marinicauda algicola TaxID=2029849 RepID=A0A4S2H0A4_9PROT|nr:ribosome maturation factor RimM [Marinicauda algicola]TGY88945.1 16S rRNA processing protein RimM [Marinicauda algicola]
MASKPDLLVIGAIAGAHGVHGEAKVRAFGDPAMIARYGPFLDPAGKVIFTPKKARHSGGETVIVTFKEPVTREALIAMKGTLLHVPRAALPEPDEDEFYYSDLLGLAVEDLAGEPLGTVKAVNNFGAGDLLEILPPEGPSFYLPFTKQAVPHIDLKAGRLVANPPEAEEDEDDEARE